MNNEYFFDVVATPAPKEVHIIYRDRDDYERRNTTSSGIGLLALFIALFILTWVIAGLLAFIMSLICFAYTSSMSDKFLGLIVALSIGPFYWLYYIFNSNYCNKNL